MYSTILAAFTEQARLRPGSTALLAPGKRDTSFGELFQRNELMRFRLAQLGVRPGMRVGLIAQTRDVMAAAHLAAVSTATSVPLSAQSTVAEIESCVVENKVSALIIESGNDDIRSSVSALGVNVITLKPDSDRTGFFELEGRVTDECPELIAPEPDDIAVLFRTSGTTGRPKLVPRLQRSLVVGLDDDNGVMQLQPTDRVLNAMPLHHVQGLSGEFMYPLLWGASVAFIEFRPADFIKMVDQYQPTKFTLVPSMHRMVLQTVEGRRSILEDSKIKWIESSSAALTPETQHAMEAAYGVLIIQGYGATEAGGILAPKRMSEQRIPAGSVGRRAHEGIVVMDENGGSLPPNVTGEICIRSDGNITGYFDDPEANENAFRDGYYRTGDLGYIDKNDYLFVVGRVHDTINRGGEKFAPAEIDEVLLRHDAVDQAAAFGVDHEQLGQEVWAAVVLRQGSEVTPAEIRAFVATKLSFARVPKRIIIVTELPYNEIGKVVRRKLAAMFAD